MIRRTTQSLAVVSILAFAIASGGCDEEPVVSPPANDNVDLGVDDQRIYPGDHDPLLDGYLTFHPEGTADTDENYAARMCNYADSGGDIAIIEILSDPENVTSGTCDPNYAGFTLRWTVRVLGHVHGGPLPRELQVLTVNPPSGVYPQRGERGLAAIREDAAEQFLIRWVRAEVGEQPAGLDVQSPDRFSDIPDTFAELVSEMAVIKADYQRHCWWLPRVDDSLPWPSRIRDATIWNEDCRTGNTDPPVLITGNNRDAGSD